MKYHHLLLCIIPLVIGCTSPGTSTIPSKLRSPPLPFDREEFYRRYRLAEQLAEDDRVAWWTSDSIAAHKPVRLDSLDQNWFIIEKGDSRYAYYGRFSTEEKRYYPKYAFIAGRDGSISTLSPPVTDSEIDACAHAVHTGTEFFQSLLDSMQLDVSYNHYIKTGKDGTYRMWFFPAGYGNYCAHGLDVHVIIAPSGDKVIRHTVNGRFLRYFELDDRSQTVELDNTYDSIPTVGNLFFVFVNCRNFNRITIKNMNSTSTAVHRPEKNELEWELHTK